MTMLHRLLATTLIATHGATLQAGEIQGDVRNEQGTALQGVRICLSVADTTAGQCLKEAYSDRNGSYAFRGLDAAQPYTLQVLTDASLKSRKADPYPRYGWAPVTREVTLATRKDKVRGIDFTGAFNFSNFQAQFKLSGADFPELTGYDLANDYVFLKIYTTDPATTEQDLIFLGQVTDTGGLSIEVSVPLSTSELRYEIYSAAAPEPVHGSISLAGSG